MLFFTIDSDWRERKDYFEKNWKVTKPNLLAMKNYINFGYSLRFLKFKAIVYVRIDFLFSSFYTSFRETKISFKAVKYFWIQLFWFVHQYWKPTKIRSSSEVNRKFCHMDMIFFYLLLSKRFFWVFQQTEKLDYYPVEERKKV